MSGTQTTKTKLTKEQIKEKSERLIEKLQECIDRSFFEQIDSVYDSTKSDFEKYCSIYFYEYKLVDKCYKKINTIKMNNDEKELSELLNMLSKLKEDMGITDEELNSESDSDFESLMSMSFDEMDQEFIKNSKQK